MTDILGLLALTHRAVDAGITITAAAPGQPSTVDPDTATVRIRIGLDLPAYLRALHDGLEVLLPTPAASLPIANGSTAAARELQPEPQATSRHLHVVRPSARNIS